MLPMLSVLMSVLYKSSLPRSLNANPLFPRWLLCIRAAMYFPSYNFISQPQDSETTFPSHHAPQSTLHSTEIVQAQHHPCNSDPYPSYYFSNASPPHMIHNYHPPIIRHLCCCVPVVQIRPRRIDEHSSVNIVSHRDRSSKVICSTQALCVPLLCSSTSKVIICLHPITMFVSDAAGTLGATHSVPSTSQPTTNTAVS